MNNNTILRPSLASLSHSARIDLLCFVPLDRHDPLFLQVDSLSFHLVQISPGTSLGLRVELHSLRQVNFTAPIEGIGLAPHVGFPGIRTGLTTSAGLLFAAEGTADFRT